MARGREQEDQALRWYLWMARQDKYDFLKMWVCSSQAHFPSKPSPQVSSQCVPTSTLATECLAGLRLGMQLSGTAHEVTDLILSTKEKTERHPCMREGAVMVAS